MMKKKNRRKRYLLRILLIIVFLIPLLGVIIVRGVPNRLPNNNATDTEANRRNESVYTSEQLEISLLVPKGFSVKDEGIFLVLKSSDGVIEVIRNGTNFNRLDDYISNIDSQKKGNLVISQDITGKGVKRIFVSNDTDSEQKSYYLYFQNSVYIVSTTSPDLYDEVDLIAESFEYFGE